MKHLAIATAVALSMAISAPVMAKPKAEAKVRDSIFIGSFGRLHSWRAVSRDELIVWSSPSRPYLVKIWRPTSSLRFAHAIGITSTAGTVTKFDRVIVDGQRVPIKSITAIDKETAKAMRWKRGVSETDR